MAAQVEAAGQPAAADRPWYARSPGDVTAALHVDPAVGLTAARAGELLSANGPNALPEGRQAQFYRGRRIPGHDPLSASRVAGGRPIGGPAP
jgi:P-type Ca2+ transporter type 2C